MVSLFFKTLFSNERYPWLSISVKTSTIGFPIISFPLPVNLRNSLLANSITKFSPRASENPTGACMKRLLSWFSICFFVSGTVDWEDISITVDKDICKMLRYKRIA